MDGVACVIIARAKFVYSGFLFPTNDIKSGLLSCACSSAGKELIQPLATALIMELIQDERTAPMVHGLQKHMNEAINSKIFSR